MEGVFEGLIRTLKKMRQFLYYAKNIKKGMSDSEEIERELEEYKKDKDLQAYMKEEGRSIIRIYNKESFISLREKYAQAIDRLVNHRMIHSRLKHSDFDPEDMKDIRWQSTGGRMRAHSEQWRIQCTILNQEQRYMKEYVRLLANAERCRKAYANANPYEHANQ